MAERSTSGGPWRALLRTLARGARRWAEAVLDERDAHARVTASVPLLPAETVPEEATAVFGVDDGPPAHWVERVRHAAPELLRGHSVERQGTRRPAREETPTPVVAAPRAVEKPAAPRTERPTPPRAPPPAPVRMPIGEVEHRPSLPQLGPWGRPSAPRRPLPPAKPPPPRRGSVAPHPDLSSLSESFGRALDDGLASLDDAGPAGGPTASMKAHPSFEAPAWPELDAATAQAPEQSPIERALAVRLVLEDLRPAPEQPRPERAVFTQERADVVDDAAPARSRWPSLPDDPTPTPARGLPSAPVHAELAPSAAWSPFHARVRPGHGARVRVAASRFGWPELLPSAPVPGLDGLQLRREQDHLHRLDREQRGE